MAIPKHWRGCMPGRCLYQETEWRWSMRRKRKRNWRQYGARWCVVALTVRKAGARGWRYSLVYKRHCVRAGGREKMGIATRQFYSDKANRVNSPKMSCVPFEFSPLNFRAQ
jgi:hypothetical protein